MPNWTRIRLLGAVTLTGLSTLACGRLSLPQEALRAPELPSFRPAVVGTVSVSKPDVEVSGSKLTVAAKGLEMTLDLGQLLDVDRGFQQVGADPDVSQDAAILSAAVEGLFGMGYFDELGPLNQKTVDSFLSGVRFTKPIEIEVPDHPGRELWAVAALQGDTLLGAAKLVENNGAIQLASVEHPNPSSGLASLLRSYPSLSQPSAVGVLTAPSIGFSVSSVGGSQPVRVEVADAGQGTSPLDFFWLPRGGTSGVTVTSMGRIFQYVLPLSAQDVADTGAPLAFSVLRQVGQVTPSAAELRELGV